MKTRRRSLRVLFLAPLAVLAALGRPGATAAQEHERMADRGTEAIVAELKGIRAALERQARRYEADLALRRLELAMQRLAPVREERRRLKEEIVAASAELQSTVDELQFLQRRQRESDVLEEDRARMQARIDQLQVAAMRLRRREEQLRQEFSETDAEYGQFKGAVDGLEKAADRALNPTTW